MFLQAAGLGAGTVRAIAEGRDAHSLTERQRALIAFATRITQSPCEYCAADTQSILESLGSEGDLIEAANVTAGFNFANRCGDALGVRQEVPALLRRIPWLRWWIMGTLSWFIRRRMNLDGRAPAAIHSEDILGRLQADMHAAGMGGLPSFFDRLRVRPDILAVQATATRAVLLESGLPRSVSVQVAYLVSVINGDDEWAAQLRDVLLATRIPLPPLDAPADGDAWSGLQPVVRAVCDFARDVTLHAHRTTHRQVESLRRAGLTDVLILDLVALVAAVNSGNRLNRILAPRPSRGSPMVENIALGVSAR